MKYSIHLSQFNTNWFDEIVHSTLNMYCRGVDTSESPFVVYGRQAVKDNNGHADYVGLSERQIEPAVQKRQEKLFKLYEDTKTDGYDGSEIFIWFDDNGQLELYDGYHRISVMKYISLDVLLKCETNWTGIDNSKGRDFPLVDVLLKEHPIGKMLYQPVDDDRVSGWKIDRRDSQNRLEFILPRLTGNTVLDIGCSEGFFDRQLATQNYKVKGIDKSAGYVAVDTYLAAINNVKIEYEKVEWQEYLKRDEIYYDNILFLSVLHNTMKFIGIEESINLLALFKNKCKKLFFEVPNNTREIDWSADRYDFHNADNIKNIEKLLDMHIVDVYDGTRKIYVLEPGIASPQTIAQSEWERHNRWESNWWGNCRNTFDEQIKQESYAHCMKLDQYATHRKSFDLKKKSVLDIGGGPVSLLLRCYNYSRAVVVDPCRYPRWVADRYECSAIEYIQEKAETVNLNTVFDEVWIYNVLQHVQSPEQVVANAIKHGKKIRVIENLEHGVSDGHPHNLTKEYLDTLFCREGLVDKSPYGNGKIYFGVFSYGN